MCGKEVLINQKFWAESEMPYALCEECFGVVPVQAIPAVYLMKGQLAYLHQTQERILLDMKHLFDAQQELEQAFFESRS